MIIFMIVDMGVRRGLLAKNKKGPVKKRKDPVKHPAASPVWELEVCLWIPSMAVP